VRFDANSAHSTLKPTRGFLATKLALSPGEIEVFLPLRDTASFFVVPEHGAAAADFFASAAGASSAGAASLSMHGPAGIQSPLRSPLGGLLGGLGVGASGFFPSATIAASSSAHSSVIAEKSRHKLVTSLTLSLDASCVHPTALGHVPALQTAHVADLASAAGLPFDLPTAFAGKEAGLFVDCSKALEGALPAIKSFITGLSFSPMLYGFQAVFDVPAIHVDAGPPSRGVLGGAADTVPGAAASWDFACWRQYLDGCLTGVRVREWSARNRAVCRDFIPDDPSGSAIASWFPVQVAKVVAARFISILNAVEVGIVTAPGTSSAAVSASGHSARDLIMLRCMDWLLDNINTAIASGFVQVCVDARDFRTPDFVTPAFAARAGLARDAAGSQLGKRKLAALEGPSSPAVAHAARSPSKRPHVSGDASSASRGFVRVPEPAADFMPVVGGPVGAGPRLAASARALASNHPHLRLQFVAPSGAAKMGTSTATGLDMWPPQQAIDYHHICILHLSSRRGGVGHSTYDCTQFARLYRDMKDPSAILPRPTNHTNARDQYLAVTALGSGAQKPVSVCGSCCMTP